MKLAFLGGGRMAEAIISSILNKDIAKPSEVAVGEPVQDRRTYLTQRYGIQSTPSNCEALKQASLIILAVKPQTLPAVVPEIKQALTPQQTILSIMAGVRIRMLMQELSHPAIIRVMPNTPAQVGAGMSVWTSSPEVPEHAQSLTQQILQSLGEEIYVSDEHLLDMATAINGSGPAYVFRFIEALIEAGVYLGMPQETVRQLVLQTVLGSTLLMQQTGKHPAELREMVTSPGGTTAEALLVLESQGFAEAIKHAVVAAYEKTLELGE